MKKLNGKNLKFCLYSPWGYYGHLIEKLAQVNVKAGRRGSVHKAQGTVSWRVGKRAGVCRTKPQYSRPVTKIQNHECNSLPPFFWIKRDYWPWLLTYTPLQHISPHSITIYFIFFLKKKHIKLFTFYIKSFTIQTKKSIQNNFFFTFLYHIFIFIY